MFAMHVEAAAACRLSIVALACVLASCSGTDGPGGGPAFTNSIVFVSDRSGQPQLYTMKSDGSHVQQLTTVVGDKDSPVFSPDGRRVAFVMSDTASGGAVQSIYVINADGSELRQLTSGLEQDLAPSWSPDGSQIAFVSSRALNVFSLDVYVMNADGSGPHAILADSSLNVSPSWSPSANEILFERDLVHDVYRMTPSGDSITFLVSGSKPEWSPSGTQFLFDCGIDVCISRTRDATVVDTIGHVLHIDFTYVSQPKWSPDGGRFAYVTVGAGFGGAVEIWTASTTDGSGAVQLTADTDGRNWSPDWSRH
jgi:dipeptidyl aminopeptidase/acylaminoacyl peptidase